MFFVSFLILFLSVITYKLVLCCTIKSARYFLNDIAIPSLFLSLFCLLYNEFSPVNPKLYEIHFRQFLIVKSIFHSLFRLFSRSFAIYLLIPFCRQQESTSEHSEYAEVVLHRHALMLQCTLLDESCHTIDYGVLAIFIRVKSGFHIHAEKLTEYLPKSGTK